MKQIILQYFQMETLTNKYSRLIDHIYNEVKSNSKYDQHREQYLKQKFHQDFLPKVQKYNQIPITLDNYFSQVLLSKMNQISLNSGNFKSYQKRIMFFQSFAQVLKANRFISKWEWKQIEKRSNEIRNTTQFKWNTSLFLIEYSDDQAEFRTNFFDKYIGIEVDEDINDEEIKQFYAIFWNKAFSEKINRQLLLKLDNIICRFESKKEIYSPELLELIEDKLGSQIGSDASTEANIKIIQKEDFGVNDEVKEFYEERYKYIGKILDKFCQMNDWKSKQIQMHVDKIGSSTNDSLVSNLQIRILTKSDFDEMKIPEKLLQFLNINLFKEMSKKEFKVQIVRVVKNPLIKLLINKSGMISNFSIILDKQEQNTHQHNILREIAEQSYLMRNQQTCFEIEKYIQILMGRLSEELKRQYQCKNTYGKIYGSYQSQFCLADSDIDLTIFAEKEGYNNQRKRDEQILRWIGKILNENKEQLKIIYVRQVINNTIKVPFINIDLFNAPISNIDIVANNEDGVKNSSLLRNFGSNPVIRNLGLLLKKWAKKVGLITRYRLSSYGILLMLLFYLMSHAYIDFIENINIRMKVKLRKKVVYEELLSDLLAYYSEGSFFHREKKTICILKHCEKGNHEQLNRDNFILNIHDPIDDSNPGRMKKKEENLFFEEVRKARFILKNQKSRAIIRDLFY